MQDEEFEIRGMYVLNHEGNAFPQIIQIFRFLVYLRCFLCLSVKIFLKLKTQKNEIIIISV